MERAHLEQSQMLIILSVTVEETGEKDGVLHVGNHQVRGGLNKTDQTDTRCNCRASPRYLFDQNHHQQKFLWPPMQIHSLIRSG